MDLCDSHCFMGEDTVEYKGHSNTATDENGTRNMGKGEEIAE